MPTAISPLVSLLSRLVSEIAGVESYSEGIAADAVILPLHTGLLRRGRVKQRRNASSPKGNRDWISAHAATWTG